MGSARQIHRHYIKDLESTINQERKLLQEVRSQYNNIIIDTIANKEVYIDLCVVKSLEKQIDLHNKKLFRLEAELYNANIAFDKMIKQNSSKFKNIWNFIKIALRDPDPEFRESMPKINNKLYSSNLDAFYLFLDKKENRNGIVGNYDKLLSYLGLEKPISYDDQINSLSFKSSNQVLEQEHNISYSINSEIDEIKEDSLDYENNSLDDFRSPYFNYNNLEKNLYKNENDINYSCYSSSIDNKIDNVHNSYNQSDNLFEEDKIDSNINTELSYDKDDSLDLNITNNPENSCSLNNLKIDSVYDSLNINDSSIDLNKIILPVTSYENNIFRNEFYKIKVLNTDNNYTKFPTLDILDQSELNSLNEIELLKRVESLLQIELTKYNIDLRIIKSIRNTHSIMIFINSLYNKIDSDHINRILISNRNELKSILKNNFIGIDDIDSYKKLNINILEIKVKQIKIRSYDVLSLLDKSKGLIYCCGLNNFREPIKHSGFNHIMVTGNASIGKTNGIKSIIYNLLYMHTPNQLKLSIIDMSNNNNYNFDLFSDIKHLITPISKDYNSAINNIQIIFDELYRRKILFKILDVDNIITYNKKLSVSNDQTLYSIIPNNVNISKDKLEIHNISPIIVVIDGLRKLKTELMKSQTIKYLNHIIEEGNKYGINFIVCNDNIDNEIDSSFNLKMLYKNDNIHTSFIDLESKEIIRSLKLNQSLHKENNIIYEDVDLYNLINNDQIVSNNEITRLVDFWKDYNANHTIKSHIDFDDKYYYAKQVVLDGKINIKNIFSYNIKEEDTIDYLNKLNLIQFDEYKHNFKVVSDVINWYINN